MDFRSLNDVFQLWHARHQVAATEGVQTSGQQPLAPTKNMGVELGGQFGL